MTEPDQEAEKESQSKRSSTNPTPPSGSNYLERLQFYQRQIPEGYEDEFDNLLGKGAAPNVAAAVVTYINGVQGDGPSQSQKSLAEEFDTSTPTISKYATILWEDIWSLDGDVPTAASRPSRAVDEIIQILWHSKRPQLSTSEIHEQSEFSYPKVGQALRTLAKKHQSVGGRYAIRDGNQVKIWWAVGRPDTPPHEYERREDLESKPVIIRDIGELAGLERAETSIGDGDYLYTTTYGIGGNETKATLRPSGIRKITGRDTPLHQVQNLEKQFGLKIGRDMSLSLHLNKRGLQKIRDKLRKPEEG